MENEAVQIDPESVHGLISRALEKMRADSLRTRELALAITKAQECLMWLDCDARTNR